MEDFAPSGHLSGRTLKREYSVGSKIFEDFSRTLKREFPEIVTFFKVSIVSILTGFQLFFFKYSDLRKIFIRFADT